MYGVVLWSDPYVKKAVIWCEDQGNLAFYDAGDTLCEPANSFFEAGDYVEFDVSMDRDLRRARNAQAILTSQPSVLPHTLDHVDAITTRHMRQLRQDSFPETGGSVIQLSDHVNTNRTTAVPVNRRG